MDYVPDPETGLLTEEYVDVYGVPFSLIPFRGRQPKGPPPDDRPRFHVHALPDRSHLRSEEHTSELQSRENLVCRLLLEKKKKTINAPCADGRSCSARSRDLTSSCI